MPRFGNVEVGEDFFQKTAPQPAPAARPGLGSIVAASARNAYGQVRYGIPLAVEKLAGTLDANDAAFYAKGLSEADAAGARAAPSSVDDLTAGRVGLGRFVAENFAASVPQTLGTLAGGVAGGLVGGPVGALAGATAVGTPFFVGSNVDRAVQENGGLSTAAAQDAFTIAPVQAASDVLVERFLPGAGKFLGGFAARQTGNFLTRTAKSIAKAGATEAVTEAGQQLGERQAAGLDVTGPDAAAEYVNAAVTAFAVGGVLGAGGGIRRGAAHIKPAAEVTAPDIAATVDQALGLTDQRGAASLGLPAPGQGVQVAPGNDVSRASELLVDPRGNIAPNTRRGVEALAATPVANVAVDERGEAIPSPTSAELAAFANRPVGPGLDPEANAREAQARQLAEQNFQLGQNILDIRNTVADIIAGRNRAVPAALAATTPPTRVPLSAGTSTQALGVASAGGVTGAAPDPSIMPVERLFTTAKLDELNVAVRAKDAAPELKADAQDELKARWSEAAGAAPLTTTNFAERLTEVKAGLRGSFVIKLDAANPAELVDKVYEQVLVNQDTSANVVKLAQRVGLLDEKLEPTARANEIEMQRAEQARAELEAPAATPSAGTPVGTAPAESTGLASTQTPETVPTPSVIVPPAPSQVASLVAPTADPGFDAQWTRLKAQAGIARQSGAKSIGTPVNLQDAQARVIQALADDKTTRNGDASQVERLAQKMGLVTADESMDITPLGRQAYLATAPGREDVTAAAREQGYTDVAQSTFERGVQAQLGGPEVASYSSFEDMAAYQAGKAWAQDFVSSSTTKTLQQTRAIQERQAARANGKPLERKAIERAPLTAAQVQQRGLNSLLDNADLRQVPDTDVAALRRMVRDGATATEVGQALAAAQGGQALFQQPETTPTVLSPPPVRGQPVFKEMNEARKQVGRAQKNGIRTFRLREVIKQAVLDKEITVARADKLNDMLDEGKIDQVGSVVTNLDANSIGAYMVDDFDLDRVLGTNPATDDWGILRYPPKRFEPLEGRAPVRNAGFDEREEARHRKAFWRTKEGGFATKDGRLADERTSGASDAAFEQAIDGKSFADALQYMVDNAPSKYLTAIMEQVQQTANTITAVGGHEFELRVVKPGDRVPIAMLGQGTRAFAQVTKVPAKSTVWLKSAELGPAAGTNFQVAAHEMVHAVTMQALQFGRRGDQANTRIGKAVRDLRDLGDAVVRHLNERRRMVGDEGLNAIERSIFNRQINALVNQDEVLAWGLTNPEFQGYLESIEYAPRQSVFSRFVDLLRSLLGLDTKFGTALTELLRVSEQVLGANERELAPAFVGSDPQGGVMAPLQANLTEEGTSAANRTVQASNETLQRLVSATDQVVGNINPQDLKVKARRVLLGWQSLGNLVRTYGDTIPGIKALYVAKSQHDAVRGRFSSMGGQLAQDFAKLERDNPARTKQLGELMLTTTQFKLDPEKTFDDHTHLVDSPNVGALRGLHAQIVKMKNDLSRGDGAGYKLFQEMRAGNETMNYARLAQDLHRLVTLDPEYTLGVDGANINPMDDFMTRDGLDTQDAIKEYWRKALDQQLSAANDFVTRKRGEASRGTLADQNALKQHLSPIDERIGATYTALKAMQQAPYFHLGRFGDNFGSAVIRTNGAGTVDPAAQKHVAEELEKAGFGFAELSEDNTRPRFNLKFETVDQERQFRALALKLENEGWIESGSIKSGPTTRADNYGVADNMPGFILRYIERIKASPSFVPEPGMTRDEVADLERRKNEAVQLAMDEYVASQPDNSIAKVLTARYTVPGFDQDMMRSFAHRWNVGAASLASVSTSAVVDRAYQSMRTQATEATQGTIETDAGPIANTADPNVIADVLTEAKKREAINPLNDTSRTFLDKARGWAHAYFLGFSPAYGAIQLMQVGTNAIPELAKTHGFGKSFHAIRQATPKALAVLRAVMSEARAQGWQHYGDLTLTEGVLQKAGLSKGETDFLRRMIATGSIDIGSSAYAIGQVARGNTGSKRDIALKYASAIGMYTETGSRLITALAAHQLHGGTGQESAKYAQGVVSNSMFDYQNWNRARQLGKQGFAGPVTPLVTQFMTYSTQMTEKLFSEFHGAVAKQSSTETAESAEARRKASRTYLAGHLTAITALAGTLGLPFASVFAVALERLMNGISGDDDEPFDATASWRGFVSGVFGKDIGEVLSRGLPRAAGFDISARVGEADLIPFAQLLSDQRGWKEAIGSAAGRAVGATPDMLTSLADGGAQFLRGDVLGGMTKMLPVAFKGPAEAYRMTTEGYVDTRGNKLPLTPGSASILWRLLGFNPAEKAEYSEARGDQQVRRLGLTQRANRARQQIVRALTSGDQERATELIAEAQKFDAANPAFAVIPSLGAAMTRQQESTARARALGTPLGVAIDDLAGQNLTRYANVGY